ncbi:ImmA/IrrE family metallo-endopeptidase [Ruminococcus sp. AF18-22]|nr:ImmA/IrrE family metallo-endopeptidase [Ruminococcus sp. AF18-22]
MDYESLLSIADTEGLAIKERPFRTYDGRIKGNNIYLRKGMTTTQKTCVLAEELGHHHTSVGNIIDMSDTANRKQERQARMWAYNRLIGLCGIIKAYKAGCQNRYEIAEYLEVTEECLQECIECYRDKYGVYTAVDNYVIYFLPNLAVMEKV